MAKLDEHIKVMMLKGETGANIKSIDKTATSGLVDTYTVTLTDGTKSNFTVTNGKDGKDGAGFDTFEIGGRNLFTGTRDFSGSNWINKNNWVEEADTYNGFSVFSSAVPGSGLYQIVHANKGESYVLSGYFKADAGSSVYAYFGENIYPSNALLGQPGEDLTTWRRFSAQFRAYADTEINSRIENQTRGKRLYVCGLKLERSTKPSDWTPAPEDKADVSALAGKADVSAIVPKASVESSATASQAYAAGQYVVVNGILRKVKSAIAKGNTISDFNSTATTVVGELATLGDSVSKQQAANRYSTSETDTGRTWVDGKKIYRRVVRFGQFGSGETRKSIGFSYGNIVSAVFLSGDSSEGTGAQMPLYPNDTYWRADATMYGTDVVVRIGVSFGSCYVTGVFEYTK